SDAYEHCGTSETPFTHAHRAEGGRPEPGRMAMAEGGRPEPGRATMAGAARAGRRRVGGPTTGGPTTGGPTTGGPTTGGRADDRWARLMARGDAHDAH